MSPIEALYIFDEHNNLILEHVYTGRPPSARVLLPVYFEHPAPRPSLIYAPNTNPPSLVHSIIQDRLLFLSPSAAEIEPLLVLEFLHRVADALEDFLGSPLLASRIEGSYEVVSQLLGEMCDSGLVSNTEPNTLRDVVEAPSWMGKLLGGVGLPSSSPSLSPSGSAPFSLSRGINPLSPTNASPVPWRRANVRHTSNELYVDVVESLSVIIAPSGRPLTAFANGTIAFTAKVSGIPDIRLNLSAPGGVSSILSLPVFHQCVRLARWRENPGELSFVPPDGRFVLIGYEVDLLGSGTDSLSSLTTDPKRAPKLNIPATVEMSTSLGPTGCDFEARLMVSSRFRSSGPSPSASSSAFGKPVGRAGSTFGGGGGTSSHPTLEDVIVSVPVPEGVKTIADLRASRGEVQYAPGEAQIEWRLNGKDVSTLLSAGHGVTIGAAATLRGTVVGAIEATNEDVPGTAVDSTRQAWEYDEVDDNNSSYQNAGSDKKARSSDHKPEAGESGQTKPSKIKQNKVLMPSSAMVSYQVKGWLASGIKVDSLVVDPKKSRGLGSGVTPYKGVKYVTVSKKGVEARC